MIHWVYPSPHPKQHLDWISRFCTAHRSVSLYFTDRQITLLGQ